MQKVIVQVDWTTKIILILIAVLLAGILIKPNIQIEKSRASDVDWYELLRKTTLPIAKAESISPAMEKFRRLGVASAVEGSYEGAKEWLRRVYVSGVEPEEMKKLVKKDPFFRRNPCAREYALFLLEEITSSGSAVPEIILENENVRKSFPAPLRVKIVK